MSARLLSIGTATPAGTISQARAADLACRLTHHNGHERAIRALYQRAGVRERGCVLVRDDGSLDLYDVAERSVEVMHGDLGDVSRCDPSTGARLLSYTPQALELAERACAQALERAGVLPRDVTHLITVSCTGFEAPGVDCLLIDALALPSTVRRTHIGFMGCHGAINALAAAKAYAQADVDARVLVCCVELCTLHFQYEGDQGASVANALFADGAAAAVVACCGHDGAHRHAPVIRTAQSVILPNTRDAMTWRIGDHGFVMSLSSRVPGTLAAAVPGWLEAWLPRYGFAREAVRSWAIHPGGPRILGALETALGLDGDALTVSRDVLARHGNMSSPTVLFIAEQALRRDDSLPLIAMAFGPGLTGEAVLLTEG